MLFMTFTIIYERTITSSMVYVAQVLAAEGFFF